MKRKSQFCYLGTDAANWKVLSSSGFKIGSSFTSDFFNAMMAASGKTEPVIGIVEFSSEDGLSLNIRTDSWGRNSLYTVQDAKAFRPLNLRLLTKEEVSVQLEECKKKGHDFMWLLTKMNFG